MKSKKLTAVQRVAQLEELFAQSVQTISTLARGLSELQQKAYPERFTKTEVKND